MTARQSIIESIERTLALTPGLASAEATLTLLLARQARGGLTTRRRSPGQRQADAAALLAHAQSPDVLLSLFERHGGDAQHHELLACLVQEMALRSIPVVGAVAEFWGARVAHAGHPLGWLPPVLLMQENVFPKFLPGYSPQVRSWAYYDPATVTVGAMRAPVEMSIAWTEVEVSAGEQARVQSAIASWPIESNGKIESRLFRADVPLLAEAVTDAAVLSLPLQCLEGAKAGDLWLVPYSVADALAALFSAAATGGAYNSGRGGAYGRLETWRSAGGLVGTTEGDSLGTVAALASRCAWFYFFAKSAWFYDVARDNGLMALRPDGRTLAVLAATDTD